MKYDEPFLNELLKKMNLEEKIGQLYQAPFFSTVVTGHAFNSEQTLDDIAKGRVGSVLSVYDKKTLKLLQETAVETSRLGIPLLFCFDVIHGFQTAFPINLAQAASWDQDLVQSIAHEVAKETRQGGIHLTFSPMVDIVRDPRWGRVMESNGEDPFLSSQLAQAYVRGYQGDDLNSDQAVASCVKHFAGYGAIEAGREYNTVDLSERVLRNTYFPPFKSAIDAQTPMVMTAFNTLFDRPCTANRWLLHDVLRDEMGFEGIVISDYTSSKEIIDHKVATDAKDAALQCFQSGLDHEMVATTYRDHLADWVNTDEIPIEEIDRRVMRVLKLKAALGLFEHPYRGLESEQKTLPKKSPARDLAKEAVEKTSVLLKNNGILPLSSNKTVVLCGPFADSQDLIGEWAARCKKEDVVTLKEAFVNDDNVRYLSLEEPLDLERIDILKNADAIVLAIGENGSEAGEGNSKTDITFKKSHWHQWERLQSLNPNIIVVIFAGRPLILTELEEKASAILYAWQPGTEAGHGLRNLLLGKASPSAKLPMTFPRHQGQIPLYYNHYTTGRPFDIKRPSYRYNTRYIDCVNEPLYPFGYGLSYTEFRYENITLSHDVIHANGTVLLSVDVTNTGKYVGTEIVQMYIEALAFSVARPVNELKGYQKITLNPLEKTTVVFPLTIDTFRSYNIDMKYTAEKRVYKVKVGAASHQLHELLLNVIDY